MRKDKKKITKTCKRGKGERERESPEMERSRSEMVEGKEGTIKNKIKKRGEGEGRRMVSREGEKMK